MVSVSPIRYDTVRQYPELVDEYARETRIPGMALPVPQWEVYAALEQAGVYAVFGLYVDDVLAGFSGVLTTANPHHGVKIANVESLFVSRACRSETAGARLMRAVESYARAEGCEDILYSARAGSRLEVTLAKRWARTNSVFCVSLRSVAGGPGCDLRGGERDPDAAAGGNPD